MNLRKPKIVDGFLEYEYTIPSMEEMIFVERTNAECRYFRYGISECRAQIAREYLKDPEKMKLEGFSRCLNILESEYKCSTKELLEPKIEDSPEGRLYFAEFSKCFFKDYKKLGYCRKYLDDHVRRLFRMPNSPLNDYQKKFGKEIE